MGFFFNNIKRKIVFIFKESYHNKNKGLCLHELTTDPICISYSFDAQPQTITQPWKMGGGNILLISIPLKKQNKFRLMDMKEIDWKL